LTRNPPIAGEFSGCTNNILFFYADFVAAKSFKGVLYALNKKKSGNAGLSLFVSILKLNG